MGTGPVSPWENLCAIHEKDAVVPAGTVSLRAGPDFQSDLFLLFA
jgi:hypothetical protein